MTNFLWRRTSRPAMFYLGYKWGLVHPVLWSTSQLLQVIGRFEWRNIAFHYDCMTWNAELFGEGGPGEVGWGGDGCRQALKLDSECVCVVNVTLAHLVQRHSLRVFVWSSPTERSRREPESPRGEYDTSFAFDHFIKFAWKNRLKSRI